MEKSMNIALLGFGTVGRATVEVLDKNREKISRRCGMDLRLTAVATRTPGKAQGLVSDDCRLTDSIEAVVTDPRITVVVELMGGIDAAYKAILLALDNGKHVVTANKALLAAHGNEIFETARRNQVMVAYEAAVAVAIPIIKIIRESMSANRIESIAGIVNGTSNFILTQMAEHGRSYAEALAEAQRLGFAEADPSFDVNGNDAAHKLTILAAIAFGMPMNLAQVHTEGISGLHIEDVRYAETLGYRIKLLAIARRSKGGVELHVQPALVKRTHMLANVSGEMNGILVKGDVSGTTFHYGAGAGGVPTASAVISDLVDIARLLGVEARHQVPLFAFQHDQLQALPVIPQAEIVSPFYLRIKIADELGALAAITSVLAEYQVSVDVIHHEAPSNGWTDLIIVTHEAVRSSVDKALAQVQIFSAVSGEIVALRIESLS